MKPGKRTLHSKPCIRQPGVAGGARNIPKASPQNLSALLEERAQGIKHERVSIGDMLQLFGDRSMAGLLLMFALPMALPIPLPGLSVPFGACMVILSIQLAMRRQHAWLPAFLRRRAVSRAAFAKLVERMVPALRRLERLVRPRRQRLVMDWMMLPIGLICLILSLLVALPIPLSNAIPGAAIAVLALGVLERDGITLWIGMIVAAVAIALVVIASNGAYDALLNWVHAHY